VNFFYRELWKVFSKQIIAKIGHGLLTKKSHHISSIKKKEKLITYRGDLWIRARYLKPKKIKIQFIIIILSQCENSLKKTLNTILLWQAQYFSVKYLFLF
jgi:hypothetical protein